MKKIAIGIATIAALTGTPALAADLGRPVYKAQSVPAPPPAFNWTGWYVGANVGGHRGRDAITTTFNRVGFHPPLPFNADTLSPVTLNPAGVIGGLQIGYNWQLNNTLLGIEADADWLGGTASRNLVYPGPNPAAGDVLSNSTEGRFLATIRPRLGVTFDQVLLYATGGVAFESVKDSDSLCNQGCPTAGANLGANLGSASTTTTRTGWTAGGGLEYAFSRNWSVKAEYLYVGLGSFDTSIPSPASCTPTTGCGVTVHHNYSDQVARVGLSYLFH